MAGKRVLSESTIVTPYLAVQGASKAIEFYQKAFGAEEIYRIQDEDGRIGHAEIRIGGAAIFISDEYPEIRVHSAQRLGDSPVMIVLDVPDVDAFFQRAVAAGAIVERPLQDGFDGALRTAKLVDPFKHRWMITTRYQVEE
jgi:PhnB protein